METQKTFSFWDEVILSKKDNRERTMPKDYRRNKINSKCLEDPFAEAVLPTGKVVFAAKEGVD